MKIAEFCVRHHPSGHPSPYLGWLLPLPGRVIWSPCRAILATQSGNSGIFCPFNDILHIMEKVLLPICPIPFALGNLAQVSKDWSQVVGVQSLVGHSYVQTYD